MVISVDFPVFLNVAGENLNQPISLNYPPPSREGCPSVENGGECIPVMRNCGQKNIVVFPKMKTGLG